MRRLWLTVAIWISQIDSLIDNQNQSYTLISSTKEVVKKELKKVTSPWHCSGGRKNELLWVSGVMSGVMGKPIETAPLSPEWRWNFFLGKASEKERKKKNGQNYNWIWQWVPPVGLAIDYLSNNRNWNGRGIARPKPQLTHHLRTDGIYYNLKSQRGISFF